MRYLEVKMIMKTLFNKSGIQEMDKVKPDIMGNQALEEYKRIIE
jgi:hypothetical protein